MVYTGHTTTVASCSTGTISIAAPPSTVHYVTTRTPPSDIRFFVRCNTLGVEVEALRLTTDGFEYQGRKIEDAGEAYRLFCKVMNIIIEEKR